MSQAHFYTILSAFVLGLIAQGWIEVPLPYPAHHHVIGAPPADSLPWKPVPLEGSLALNTELQSSDRLFHGQVQGSETVAFADDGSMLLLDKFGWLHQALPNGSAPGGWSLQPEPLLRVGVGRPLGFHLVGSSLYVCDSGVGLLHTDLDTGRTSLLSSSISASSALDPKQPVVYANGLDISYETGDVFFSASQDISPARHKQGFGDTYEAYMLGLYAAKPTGKLLRYIAATGETHALANGIWYANGVALSADESFVAVVETSRTRVLRHWLKGPKAGTTDVLVEHLPGVPDGISRAANGGFWVSLVVPIKPVSKLLPYRLLRALMAWLPQEYRPSPGRWGAVLRVSQEGEMLELLSDPDGSRVAYISSTTEYDGALYFGNVKEDYVSVWPAMAVAEAGVEAGAEQDVEAPASDAEEPAEGYFAEGVQAA